MLVNNEYLYTESIGLNQIEISFLGILQRGLIALI